MNQELSLEQRLAKLDPALCPKQMSRHYKVFDTRKAAQTILNLTIGGEPAFELVDVYIKKTKKNKNTEGLGSHMVKLRMKQEFEINGERLHPEIIIKNSYDGSCPLRAYLGVYRIFCSNGLVVTLKDFGEIKIRHMGTEEDAAFEILGKAKGNLMKAVELQGLMADTQMTELQIKDFAHKAAQIRWEKVSEDADFEELLETVRPEDEGNSVWVVYNRVQEKMINGGIKLDGMKRKGKALANSIKEIEVNERLFDLALSYVSTSELVENFIDTQVDETMDVDQLETV